MFSRILFIFFTKFGIPKATLSSIGECVISTDCSEQNKEGNLSAILPLQNRAAWANLTMLDAFLNGTKIDNDWFRTHLPSITQVT